MRQVRRHPERLEVTPELYIVVMLKTSLFSASADHIVHVFVADFCNSIVSVRQDTVALVVHSRMVDNVVEREPIAKLETRCSASTYVSLLNGKL